MLPHYGRVKSELRKFSLTESLTHLWQLSRHICGEQSLPYHYAVRDPAGKWGQVKKYIFPHHLDLLARELLLHADRTGKPGARRLDRWSDLAAAANVIKEFGNDVFDPDSKGGVLITLHRIAHQQFPHFSPLTKEKLGKYLALYRTPGLKAVFERRLRIDVDTYFVLAFGVIASAKQRPQINTSSDFLPIGVDIDQSQLFFERISGPLSELRNKLIETQLLNHCWEYTFNALHFKPLVRVHERHPECLYCPLPQALEKRLLEGLYFDLHRDSKFALPYGRAFEHIVGRALQVLTPRFVVEEPEPSHVGKNRFDGADFIVSQGSSSRAFIECKAKRVSLSGRVVADMQALDRDLGVLADAIVQNYTNIHRDMQQRKACGNYFCIIITLEDWFLFSLVTAEKVHDDVRNKLKQAGLPESLQERAPCRVLSFETAQLCFTLLRDSSMEEVLGLGHGPDDLGMAFANNLLHRFPDADPSLAGGFSEDFELLMQQFLNHRRVRRS